MSSMRKITAPLLRQTRKRQTLRDWNISSEKQIEWHWTREFAPPYKHRGVRVLHRIAVVDRDDELPF